MSLSSKLQQRIRMNQVLFHQCWHIFMNITWVQIHNSNICQCCITAAPLCSDCCSEEWFIFKSRGISLNQFYHSAHVLHITSIPIIIQSFCVNSSVSSDSFTDVSTWITSRQTKYIDRKKVNKGINMKAPVLFQSVKLQPYSACCSTAEIIYLRFVLLPSILYSNLSLAAIQTKNDATDQETCLTS